MLAFLPAISLITNFLLSFGIPAMTLASAHGHVDLNDFYDKNCADEMFDKYMKDTQPKYEKYMEKAQNLYNSNPPQSESDINNYLDSLGPLADDYVDNLEPYAREYIDNLGQCLK